MGKIQAMTGNTAAYTGAALCRPDLIAAYPITPQSSVVEGLAGFVYNGKLDARFVQVESEHSAMSVVQGTAAAGGRVFTATSAQGLALMYEPYFRMSTLRIPMVMAIATREMTSPETIWSGQQDAMSVRDAGWIQMFCESNQEILDMMIQAYRITENERVHIPVNVCYDGCIEEYLCDDADVVLITVGGMSGTGKDAVDAARENGIRAGLIKLRFVRPFPAFRIANALKGKRAFAVVDRSVCFGWNAGPMYMETCAALADASDEYCHFSAIGGLGGADLSFEHMLSCIEKLEQAKSKPGAKETLWLMND